MQDGLAPGQVRRGLRLLSRVLDAMEGFCTLIGKEIYLIEPLFYHSAILYERRGCGYLMGREVMEEIHAGFSPGGALRKALDGSSPLPPARGRRYRAGPELGPPRRGHRGAVGRGRGGVGQDVQGGRPARRDRYVPGRPVLTGTGGIYFRGEAREADPRQGPQADAGQAAQGRGAEDGVPAPAQAPRVRARPSDVGRASAVPAAIVHYHEISLKRGNRPLFLRQLQDNVLRAIGDLGPVRLVQLTGRIMLDLSRHPDPARLRERLARVCGVANFSLALRTGVSREALRAAVEQVIEGRDVPAPSGSRPAAPSRPSR